MGRLAFITLLGVGGRVAARARRRPTPFALTRWFPRNYAPSCFRSASRKRLRTWPQKWIRRQVFDLAA